MHFYDILLNLPTKNIDDSYTYLSHERLLCYSLVQVEFGRQKLPGIIIRQVWKPKIPAPKIKPILKVLNPSPLLTARSFALCQYLSRYYLTSLGETIFAILPRLDILNKINKSIDWTKCRTKFILASHKIPKSSYTLAELRTVSQVQDDIKTNNIPIHISGPFNNRLLEYLKIMQSCNGQIILLFANYHLVNIALKYYKEILGENNIINASDHLKTTILRRNVIKSQTGNIKLIIGTRKTIFFPVKNLRKIIIDQPNNYGYFNDHKPAYSTRQITELLSRQFNIDLYYGDNNLDLQTLLEVKHKNIKTIKISANKKRGHIMWLHTSPQQALDIDLGKLGLIIAPYEKSGKYEFDTTSVEGISKIIQGDKICISAQLPLNQPPSARPLKIISTKKIIDYPELVYDNALLINTDSWLAQANYESIYNLFQFIYQLRAQINGCLFIHSQKEITKLQEILNLPTHHILAQLMQERKKYNLPPYSLQVDCITERGQEILDMLHCSGIPGAKKTIAYVAPAHWPPDNSTANNLYKLTDKIVINPPSS